MLKHIFLFLVLSLGCSTSMPARPTIGQELCATGCKILGGKMTNMSEQERKCYCVFDMPERLGLPGPGQSSNSLPRLRDGNDI